MEENKSYNDCVLHVPAGKKIIETPLAQLWFDEGFLFAIAKKGPRTPANLKKTLNSIKEIVGDKKVCLIADTSNTQYYSIEMREELIRVFTKLFKAVALLPCTPMGKIMSNILFMRENGLKAEVFNNLEEAKQWAREYL